jgi:demethylmenaquinone methyltransferase / 2-methoxy-6-polyprenyl-1,4-benzoquinol methylase
MPNAKIRTPNPESTWFGNRRVKPSEKTGLVQGVFASVAQRYDLMNDLMSGGLHRLWKDRLVRMMSPQAGQVIVDVAGGTGDIALRCARRTEGKAKIIVCDLSPKMLAEGKAKAIDHGWLPGESPSPLGGKNAAIEWITGNAENLPLPSRSADIYCIAFGLRNVTHIDKALTEAARVLKPGGRFYCLEFSPGVAKHLKPLYDRYCDEILPRLGGLIAQDRGSYQYLAESIKKFPDQPALAKRMEAAGLEQINWLNLTGGIAVIHSGWRV